MNQTERFQRTVHAVVAHRMLGMGKRPRKKLPRQMPPELLKKEYGAALGAIVGARTRAAFDPLLKELPGLVARATAARKHDRLDADEAERARQLIGEATRRMNQSMSTKEIQDLAEKFAARTSSYQRIQLARQTKAALGIDLFAADTKVPAIVNAFVEANVSLITNLPTRVAGEVENLVTGAMQRGDLHGDLADQLEAKFQFGEDRSKLIARDQIGKLYGQINASRQTEMGVEKFVWNTVGDERVRDEHEERDGETYDYDDPPEGELPGEPILCRCWAEPVFEGINDAADDTEDASSDDE